MDKTETYNFSYSQGYTSAGPSGIGFLPRAAENRIAYVRGFCACKAEALKFEVNKFLGKFELFFLPRDLGEISNESLRMQKKA